MIDHVVLISVDTLRADGIASNPLQLWPQRYRVDTSLPSTVLDDLAASGTFFAHAISSAPYTSASHASILTGCWPPNHGAREFLGDPITTSTIFTDARRLGYSTIIKTDFPVMIGAHLGLDRDVEAYIVEDDDEYLRTLARTGRSCSLLHFGGVHIPYGFHNLRYGGDAYRSTVAALEREVADLDVDAPRDELSETFRTGEDVELLVRYKRAIMTLYASGAYDRLFELYLDGIAFFAEHRLRRVIEALQRRLEGTRHLIVLFGDHGEEYDETNYGHYNSVTDGALRVPLVFTGTDVPSAVVTERVRTIDIVPTVRELAGWNTPSRAADGQSLHPVILDRAPMRHRRAFAQAFVARATQARRAQRSVLDVGRVDGRVEHVLYREAVYDGEHKLVRTNCVPGTENRVPVPLDPPQLELRRQRGTADESVDDPVELDRLRRLLDDYCAIDAGPAATRDLPEPLRRHLEDNGYLSPPPARSS